MPFSWARHPALAFSCTVRICSPPAPIVSVRRERPHRATFTSRPVAGAASAAGCSIIDAALNVSDGLLTTRCSPVPSGIADDVRQMPTARGRSWRRSAIVPDSERRVTTPSISTLGPSSQPIATGVAGSGVATAMSADPGNANPEKPTGTSTGRRSPKALGTVRCSSSGNEISIRVVRRAANVPRPLRRLTVRSPSLLAMWIVLGGDPIRSLATTSTESSERASGQLSVRVGVGSSVDGRGDVSGPETGRSVERSLARRGAAAGLAIHTVSGLPSKRFSGRSAGRSSHDDDALTVSAFAAAPDASRSMSASSAAPGRGTAVPVRV